MIDLAQKLKNEIYIISPHGEIAARRSPRTIDSEELKRSLKSFGKQPQRDILLMKYKDEPLLVSLSLCRSSGFLVAVIPYCTTGALLAYIEQSGREDILISNELKTEKAAKRISQGELEAVSEAFLILRGSSVGIIPKCTVSELARRVALCAETVSELVGCGIGIDSSPMLSECENFDMCFFEAFMFCFAMLVRRASVERYAELEFVMTKAGLLIRAETACLPCSDANELDEIKAFAENNGMYFSLMKKKNILCAELCPHRPDLSRLGLKNNDIFLT